MKILETTLRDGSYTINYQFNISETQYISKILDEIGFEYIEIGPGVGFNASTVSIVKPAVSDEEYIKAARSVVKKSKLGMFFIPGIATEKNIEIAKDYKLDFIRIGTNINEYFDSFKYIELCKKNKIETAANLMKSYAVSPKEFAKIANECYKAGADYIYIVDSAGGMFPEDVKNFIIETKSLNPNINLGFHGHNNLGLAIANTSEAINNGVSIVDSSIRGMGRSSGNTITEKLVLALKRLGFNNNYNLNKLFELSERVILPYLSNKPESILDIIYGYAQFHSSFLGEIIKCSKKFNIDPKDLIIEYTKIDKLTINEQKLEEIAINLSKRHKPESIEPFYKMRFSNLNEIKQIENLGQELFEAKHKYNYNTYFNLTKVYDKSLKKKISPVLHFTNGYALGSAELESIEQFYGIYESLKDKLDGFLIDKRLISDTLSKDYKNIIYYNDAELFAKAITNYILSINNNCKLNNIYINENKEIKEFIHVNIQNKEINIKESKEICELIIIGETYISYEEVILLNNLKWIILTQPGKLDPRISEKLTKIKLIRISLEFELILEILKSNFYNNLLNNIYGIRESENDIFCSGGFIGKKGAIVVDNINNINYKYGISNGDGSINYFKE